jgi:hypothetical protein
MAAPLRLFGSSAATRAADAAAAASAAAAKCVGTFVLDVAALSQAGTATGGGGGKQVVDLGPNVGKVLVWAVPPRFEVVNFTPDSSDSTNTVMTGPLVLHIATFEDGNAGLRSALSGATHVHDDSSLLHLRTALQRLVCVVPVPLPDPKRPLSVYRTAPVARFVALLEEIGFTSRMSLHPRQRRVAVAAEGNMRQVTVVRSDAATAANATVSATSGTGVGDGPDDGTGVPLSITPAEGGVPFAVYLSVEGEARMSTLTGFCWAGRALELGLGAVAVEVDDPTARAVLAVVADKASRKMRRETAAAELTRQRHEQQQTQHHQAQMQAARMDGSNGSVHGAAGTPLATRNRASTATAGAAVTVALGRLRVREWKADVTVRYGATAVNMLGLLRWAGAPVGAVQAIGDIEHASLSVSAYETTHADLVAAKRLAELARTYAVSHVATQAMLQAPKIIGSLAALGNPTGLLRDVARSVGTFADEALVQRRVAGATLHLIQNVAGAALHSMALVGEASGRLLLLAAAGGSGGGAGGGGVGVTRTRPTRHRRASTIGDAPLVGAGARTPPSATAIGVGTGAPTGQLAATGAGTTSAVTLSDEAAAVLDHDGLSGSDVGEGEEDDIGVDAARSGGGAAAVAAARRNDVLLRRGGAAELDPLRLGAVDSRANPLRAVASALTRPVALLLRGAAGASEALSSAIEVQPLSPGQDRAGIAATAAGPADTALQLPATANAEQLRITGGDNPTFTPAARSGLTVDPSVALSASTTTAPTAHSNAPSDVVAPSATGGGSNLPPLPPYHQLQQQQQQQRRAPPDAVQAATSSRAEGRRFHQALQRKVLAAEEERSRALLAYHGGGSIVPGIGGLYGFGSGPVAGGSRLVMDLRSSSAAGGSGRPSLFLGDGGESSSDATLRFIAEPNARTPRSLSEVSSVEPASFGFGAGGVGGGYSHVMMSRHGQPPAGAAGIGSATAPHPSAQDPLLGQQLAENNCFTQTAAARAMLTRGLAAVRKEQEEQRFSAATASTASASATAAPASTSTVISATTNTNASRDAMKLQLLLLLSGGGGGKHFGHHPDLVQRMVAAAAAVGAQTGAFETARDGLVAALAPTLTGEGGALGGFARALGAATQRAAVPEQHSRYIRALILRRGLGPSSAATAALTADADAALAVAQSWPEAAGSSHAPLPLVGGAAGGVGSSQQQQLASALVEWAAPWVGAARWSSSLLNV